MEKMVLTFFGCAMRTEYPKLSLRYLAGLRNLLERELGLDLVSKHQTSRCGKTSDTLTPSHVVHDRDWDFLRLVARNNGVAIYELTNSTTGGGSEVSDGLWMGVPTILLFHRRRHPKKDPSGYTCGKAGSKYVKTPVRCVAYSNPAEAVEAVRAFLVELGLR